MIKKKRILYFIVIALWITSFLWIYLQGESNVKKELVKSVIDNEQKFKQLLDVAIAFNVSSADQVTANLNWVKSNGYQHPLLSELKDFPRFNSYGFDGVGSVANEPYPANLTGIGALRDVNKETLSEINAALMLNLSTPLQKGGHDFIWSYYTSQSRFILFAPNVSITDFQLSESVYDKPFWQIALPENNPKRETLISDLYDDAAGQGLMISISSPVYSGQTFKGAVSLDVGLSYLKGVLDSGNLSLDAHLFLISKEGKIAAIKSNKGLGKLLFNGESERFDSYEIFKFSGKKYLSSELIHGKFYVIYELPRFRYNLLIIKKRLIRY